MSEIELAPGTTFVVTTGAEDVGLLGCHGWIRNTWGHSGEKGYIYSVAIPGFHHSGHLRASEFKITGAP